MCVNCSPYREHRVPTEPVPAERWVVPQRTFVDSLRAPISRAQLLRAMGGGMAMAFTGGALGWGAAQAAGGGPSLPYVVLLVLDGARPEYFKVPGIPHVQALIRGGTQYTNAFAGILESETPSGHTSIATGSEPRANGILSFWWANPENIEVDLFNPDKIRAGDMERIIRQARVPTLAGQVRAHQRKASVVALSGSKYYAADAIGGPDANVIMYFAGTAKGQFAPTYVPGHAPPHGVLTAPGLSTKAAGMALGVENHLAMRLAQTSFERTRQQVTLINLPEFDWPLGHVNGGVIDPQRVKTLMQGFDRDLASLHEAYRKAGVLNRTLFVLMADHGMMPLAHKIDKSEITSAIEKAGTHIVTDSYTSGAYLWLANGARATAAARNIANLHNPYIQSVYARVHTSKGYVYTRVTSSRLLHTASVEAANQYLLRSFNGPNAPDVAVIFTEGVGSEPGGQASWKADHGGSSWQAQHIPLFLSGHGIRSGHVSSAPARLIDVAPTVLQAMGVPHGGMQGIALADALTAAPASAVRTQKKVARQLAPVVAALQRESQLEVKARL